MFLLIIQSESNLLSPNLGADDVIITESEVASEQNQIIDQQQTISIKGLYTNQTIYFLLNIPLCHIIPFPLLSGGRDLAPSASIETNSNAINNTNSNSNSSIIKAKNLEIERLNLECLELEETCQGLKREVSTLA